MKSLLSVDDIYVGMEKVSLYDAYEEAYVEYENGILLKKENCSIDVNEIAVAQVYTELEEEDKIYLNNENIILNADCLNWIENLEKLGDFFVRVKNAKLDNSSKSFICSEIIRLLKGIVSQRKVSYEKLIRISEEFLSLYIFYYYYFDLEEENSVKNQDATTGKIIDLNEYRSRIRK